MYIFLLPKQNYSFLRVVYKFNSNVYILAECVNKSVNLLEYPVSLSYQDTNFTKFGESIIPAPLSKIDVLLSPTKS